MKTAVRTARSRLELRIVHSLATMADAWMTLGNDGYAISYPVRTQLGVPLLAIDGDDTFSLRFGRLIVHDSGEAPRTSHAKKLGFGLIHFVSGVEVDVESQERFHVKLHVPSEEHRKLWDLGTRGSMPRTIVLHVKGLGTDGQWDIADTGGTLLVEDFSFSFLIEPGEGIAR